MAEWRRRGRLSFDFNLSSPLPKTSPSNPLNRRDIYLAGLKHTWPNENPEFCDCFCFCYGYFFRWRSIKKVFWMICNEWNSMQTHWVISRLYTHSEPPLVSWLFDSHPLWESEQRYSTITKSRLFGRLMEISTLNESAMSRKNKWCVYFKHLGKKKITIIDTFNTFVVVSLPFHRSSDAEWVYLSLPRSRT